ncbi:hypothetical protein [Actinomadura macrotermitis]|uniref:Uncharacterized protein n=1 Tax=Actinomadura macrotermitis TaxID=2585200 RepID=A0A7K0BR10_9ACTN|nr:hypothetical protein [Actinomadura macrotermitis]MQY03362.1 hypothetical protein [Actinomadura macrotermitis]
MTARSPEQDGAFLEREDAGGEDLGAANASRQARHRLSFEEDAKPAASPWLHSAEVWERAGLAWFEGEEKAPFPLVLAPARGRSRRRPAIAAAAAAAVALAVAAAGGGAYALMDGGETGPAAPALTVADDSFAADPAARADGLVQDLAAVAASGGTLVAAGGEVEGDGRARAQFLVSAGKGWQPAAVRGADGAEPLPGARPRLLAGGAGRWAALGADPAGAVTAWTSHDARTWTAAPGGAAFGPADRVAALARTATGFVAVGAAKGRAVVWTSADGRAWRRDERPADVTGLDRVAASGDVLVAHGTFARLTSRTAGKGKKKRKVSVVSRGEALWRSEDGGATWTALPGPGAASGPVAGPGGFVAVREAQRSTGRGKRRATTRYGAVVTSPDGRAWTPAGEIGVPGYAGTERLAGAGGGFAALVRGAGGTHVLLRSQDGRAWRPDVSLGGPAQAPAPAVGDLAVADGGVPVLAGRAGDDPYLMFNGPVDLRGVPGAVRPERTVAAVASGGGRTVAVGSANGEAAVWSATGGARWARVQLPGPGGPAGGPGQPRRRLTEIAFGPAGWVALGRAQPVRGVAAPLMLTSPDGATWAKAPAMDGAPQAVAAGPGGYVAVGTGRGAAAVWRSADLKTWTRGTAARGVLAGPLRLRDVAAAGQGYVAVGARRSGDADVPAVLTSPDGATWTAATAPAPPPGVTGASFARVVAAGGRVLAVGEGRAGGAPASFLAVSADAGRTWQTRPLPAPAAPVAVTATPAGFVLAAPAAKAPVVLASADGLTWRRVPVRGAGTGEQRITALASAGRELLGIGAAADHRGTRLTLLRMAAP